MHANDQPSRHIICVECAQPLDSFPSIDSVRLADSHKLEDVGARMSQRMQVCERIARIVSVNEPIKNIMCNQCSSEYLKELELKLVEAEQERDGLEEYLRSSNPIERFDPTEFDELKLKKEQANKIIEDLDSETAVAQAEFDFLEDEIKRIEVEEEIAWRELNEAEFEFENLQIESQSASLQLEISQARLSKLEKCNVLSDCFKIWHDGPFGTINSLRLGRLPNIKVEWAEINAGLGQVVLLLDTIAAKMKFKFKYYRLIPMGSFCKIEKVGGDKTIHELFGSSDLSSLLFANRRFDIGLTKFLSCLGEIGDYFEALDQRFKLPYTIIKDRIGDVSIKMQSNEDEGWTRALKFMLIDIKWMLIFSTGGLPDSNAF